MQRDAVVPGGELAKHGLSTRDEKHFSPASGGGEALPAPEPLIEQLLALANTLGNGDEDIVREAARVLSASGAPQTAQEPDEDERDHMQRSPADTTGYRQKAQTAQDELADLLPDLLEAGVCEIPQPLRRRTYLLWQQLRAYGVPQTAREWGLDAEKLKALAKEHDARPAEAQTAQEQAPEQPELKPCPFCGAEAEIVAVEEPSNVGGYVVSCKGCEASTRVWFPIKDRVDGILRDAWNRRQPSPPSAPLAEQGQREQEQEKS